MSRFARLSHVASPEYLARHGTPQHPKELSEHDCVIDSSIRTPGRWRYYDEGNDGNITADYSAAGHGIALLPDFLIQNYLDSGELVSILGSFQMPPAPMSLVYPANRMQNPVLSELVRHLLDNKPMGVKWRIGKINDLFHQSEQYYGSGALSNTPVIGEKGRFSQ